MRGSLIALTMLSALLASACQPRPPLRSDAAWTRAAAACDDAVQECRGLRGRRSTGQAFSEDDFGISARFPTGAWVCPSFSGLTIEGYLSRIAEGPFDCLDAPPPGTTAYGVRASWNAAFMATLDEGRGAGRPCRSDDRLARSPDGRPFAIRGLDSRACVERRADGGVLIEVEAAAGRWGDGFGEEAGKPQVFYTAWMFTREETWTADAAVFERFLADLSIAVPAPAE